MVMKLNNIFFKKIAIKLLLSVFKCFQYKLDKIPNHPGLIIFKYHYIHQQN